MAAKGISPRGETIKVSISSIDCMSRPFKANGHAKEKFFLT
jgi:hypothetical protein